MGIKRRIMKAHSVIIKGSDHPVFCEEIMDDFMNKDIFRKSMKESMKLMTESDLLLSVQREKKSFGKK